MSIRPKIDWNPIKVKDNLLTFCLQDSCNLQVSTIKDICKAICGYENINRTFGMGEKKIRLIEIRDKRAMKKMKSFFCKFIKNKQEWRERHIFTFKSKRSNQFQPWQDTSSNTYKHPLHVDDNKLSNCHSIISKLLNTIW